VTIKTSIATTATPALLLAGAMAFLPAPLPAQSCGVGEFACGNGCCPSVDHCASNSNGAACCPSDSPTFCNTPSGGVQCCAATANACNSNGDCIEKNSGGSGGGALDPIALLWLFAAALLGRRRRCTAAV
jgi:hypothetical protein